MLGITVKLLRPLRREIDLRGHRGNEETVQELLFDVFHNEEGWKIAVNEVISCGTRIRVGALRRIPFQEGLNTVWNHGIEGVE